MLTNSGEFPGEAPETLIILWMMICVLALGSILHLNMILYSAGQKESSSFSRYPPECEQADKKRQPEGQAAKAQRDNGRRFQGHSEGA